MELYHEIKENAYVLILSGSLDGNNSDEIHKMLHKAIKSQKENILIDCHNLSTISSAGIGVFLSILPEVKENNINLIFYGMNASIRKIFLVLGLDKVLTINDNLEAETYDVAHR